MGCDPRRRRGCWVFLLVSVVGVMGWAERARAQTVEPAPGEPPTFELPEVIVPGKRPQPLASTPASVSVLTREDLDRLGVLTIGEALQYLPETVMRLQGGLGALNLPSIRGSSPNQVLVLIDGVPVNSVIQGLFDLSTLSAASVERVEVLRGPFSALYGGPALGGVINVITTSEPGTRLAARDGGLATTGIAGRWSTPDGRVVISGDRFASSGFRPNSDVASTTALGRAIWETGAGDHVTFTTNYYQSAVGVPGSTAFPSPAARQDEVRMIASTGWTRSTDDGQWAASAYWWGDDFHFVDPASAVDSRDETQVFGTSLQRVVQRAPDHVQVFGAEGQSQALQDNGPVGNRQASLGGVYVQDEQQLTPRSLLSAGLRYDLNSVYGGQLNPRLGVVWVIRDGLTLRGGIGRTFRGPTLSELYFAPYNNPNLRPETAWSADLGLTWQMARGSEVRAGLFGTTASDLIRPDSSFVPQNIGHATIIGGSLGLAGQGHSGAGGTLDVTVMRAIDDSTGQQLLRVPWVTASAVLHVSACDGTLSALVTYIGSRLDVDPATFATVLMPAYVVAGLRFAGGAPETGQWQIGVDNIGDLQYEPIAGYPAPGRTAFISFARSF